MTEKKKPAPRKRAAKPKQAAQAAVEVPAEEPGPGPARVRCISSNIWLSTGVKLRNGETGFEPDRSALRVMLDRMNVEIVGK